MAKRHSIEVLLLPRTQKNNYTMREQNRLCPYKLKTQFKNTKQHNPHTDLQCQYKQVQACCSESVLDCSVDVSDIIYLAFLER